MPEFHAEPYEGLSGLTHHTALTSRGAFYFRMQRRRDEMRLVDDDNLEDVHPPRHESIGTSSQPYGLARVEVFNIHGERVTSAATTDTLHCWVSGLEPNTVPSGFGLFKRFNPAGSSLALSRKKRLTDELVF